MAKFEIIEALEGRYAPNPRGKYCQIKNGHYQTAFGDFALHLYEVGQLEVMLKRSISEADVRRATSERLTYLFADQIMDQDTQEAQDWFRSLPAGVKLAQVTFRYQDWSREQQQALEQAGAYE